MRALLLLENALSQSDIEKLRSHDVKIKCLALPPNTTLVIHPIGIIVICKKLYRRKFLDEMIVVLLQPTDKMDNT
jgi:hypothetical protein